MGMQAAIRPTDRTDRDPPCVVYMTRRVRLHVEVTTYCAKQIDAGDSAVIQIPDIADVCPECSSALQKVYEAILKTKAGG